jgi:hypothetical protein
VDGEPHADSSLGVVDQQSNGAGNKLLPFAIVLTTVIAAGVVVGLLQWPARSSPAQTPKNVTPQPNPSPTQSFSSTPLPAGAPATSAVETRPAPPTPRATVTETVGDVQSSRSPTTAAGVPQVRPPVSPTTRAPISVAPESRAPSPYPPSRDPSRPNGGLLGGIGGVL